MSQLIIRNSLHMSSCGGVASRSRTFPATLVPCPIMASNSSHNNAYDATDKPRLQKHDSLRAVSVASSVGSISPGEEDDIYDEDMGLGASGHVDDSELGPLPDVRYQKAMHIKDRKAWRAKAETMAKEKRLIKIQVGQLGLTTPVLRACADVLQKHSLVRVKLGDGCGLERGSAAAVLEKYLDCVCVHQVGFTITLYRQAGLPRLSNMLHSGTPTVGTDIATALPEPAELQKANRKKAGQQKPGQRPPEFSVL